MSESFGCFSLSGQVNSARPSVTRDIDQISVSVNLSVTHDYRIDRNGTVPPARRLQNALDEAGFTLCLSRLRCIIGQILL